jgi:hypothetical protein
MKFQQQSASSKFRLPKDNGRVDNNLVQEVARLRLESGKSRPKTSLRIEPPLGGDIPSLRLYNA